MNKNDVRVAVTGGIYIAPSGTTLPTDATTPLPAAFADLGYITPDGVTQSISKESTTIKAWQNSDELRVIQTGHTLTYAATLVETTKDVLALYYSDASATADEFAITTDQADHHVVVIEVIDGEYLLRGVIGDAQLTEVGDLVFKGDDAMGYPVTLTAFSADDGHGRMVKAKWYRATKPVNP